MRSVIQMYLKATSRVSKLLRSSVVLLSSLAMGSGTVFGQVELYRVEHLTGLWAYNGVEVNVIPEGGAHWLVNYCPDVTWPYLIGYNGSTFESVSGSYRFEFDPPVDSIRINLSGVNNIGGHVEWVRFFVNDEHIGLSAPGPSNECDELAELTSAGDVTGCTTCEYPALSGFGDIRFNGPIQSFTVQDSVVSGIPGGAVFSLYFFALPTDIPEQVENSFSLYPNPCHSEINLVMGEMEIEGFEVFDQLGQSFDLSATRDGSNLKLDTNSLTTGVYFLRLITTQGIIQTQRFIVH